MEPSPSVRVNGRFYAAGSPGRYNTTHDASAGGSQCSLWPDPIDPRNCGPVGQPWLHYKHTLLLREVQPGGTLGPAFWASDTPPDAFASATAQYHIPTLDAMPQYVQNDVAALASADRRRLCNASRDGSFKCDVCQNGCQQLDNANATYSIGAERAYYPVGPSSSSGSSSSGGSSCSSGSGESRRSSGSSSSSNEPSYSMDVILYRSGLPVLAAAVREYGAPQSAWGPDAYATNIPNDFSNLNAGRLPDGRTFLLHNPVVPLAGNGRDPVTLATSRDGLNFDSVGVVLTCSDLGPSSNCTSRYKLKTPGPSYPQGVALVDPAPPALHAFYVAASNNKEDIWLARIEYTEF